MTRYLLVAERVRAQIADGTLAPGEPVPSGAALARRIGYSTATCRKALRVLIAEGALVPGPSPGARPRVRAADPGGQSRADAARALSAALAARRHAAGLAQPQLAAATGVSRTTIGHAETGRLWQGRPFWERTDKALSADGELLRLHDDYSAATVIPEPPPESATADPAPQVEQAEPVNQAGAAPDLLTADEREAVKQAGLLYTLIATRIVTDGPTRDDDLAELRAAVHVIQRTIQAQAAARAYPGEFRLLGTLIQGQDHEPDAVPGGLTGS